MMDADWLPEADGNPPRVELLDAVFEAVTSALDAKIEARVDSVGKSVVLDEPTPVGDCVRL